MMADKKDTPEYKPTMRDVSDNVWATVEYWEMRAAAFYFATQNLTRYDRNNVVANAYSVIHEEIYKELLSAYRNLFMIGNFLGEEDRRRIRQKAFDRFMDEGKAIMYLLSGVGEEPNQFWSKVQDRLRNMLRSRV